MLLDQEPRLIIEIVEIDQEKAAEIVNQMSPEMIQDFATYKIMDASFHTRTNPINGAPIPDYVIKARKEAFRKNHARLVNKYTNGDEDEFVLFLVVNHLSNPFVVNEMAKRSQALKTSLISLL